MSIPQRGSPTPPRVSPGAEPQPAEEDCGTPGADRPISRGSAASGARKVTPKGPSFPSTRTGAADMASVLCQGSSLLHDILRDTVIHLSTVVHHAEYVCKMQRVTHAADESAATHHTCNVFKVVCHAGACALSRAALKRMVLSCSPAALQPARA